MFLLVCLFSGPANAGGGADSFQVMHYKSIKSQVREGRVNCSRNHQCAQIHYCSIASLSRRDVDLSRRDVNFTCLCHVATWTSHVATSIFTLSATSRRGFPRRDVNFYKPLSRRDVTPDVATWILMSLCDVTTSLRTSRRRLVTCSLTSRRCPSRHDVGLITLCHVATLPRTSRRCLVLCPTTVHFLPFTSHTSLIGTLAFLRISPHRTYRRLRSHWSEALTLFSDHHCAPTSHPLSLVLGHCGIPTTLCSVLAFWVVF